MANVNDKLKQLEEEAKKKANQEEVKKIQQSAQAVQQKLSSNPSAVGTVNNNTYTPVTSSAGNTKVTTTTYNPTTSSFTNTTKTNTTTPSSVNKQQKAYNDVFGITNNTTSTSYAPKSVGEIASGVGNFFMNTFGDKTAPNNMRNITDRREEAEEIRLKDNQLSTERLMGGEESKGYKLSEEDKQKIGGVVVDKSTGKQADSNYVVDLQKYVEDNAKIVNASIEDLSAKYKNGQLSYEDYLAEYKKLESQWNNDIIPKAKELEKYDYLDGNEYYEWIKKNGSQRDIEDFEAYVGSFDDSFFESLGNSYKASLIDLANTPIEAIEMLRSFGERNLENGYRFDSEDSLSSRVRQVSNEIKSYTLNGANDQGVRKYSLETISSLMPMINDIILGWATGNVLGLSGTAMETFTNVFTNVQMGIASAGDTTRQRLEEGNTFETSFYNGVLHGVITGMVEALNVGNVTNVLNLLTGAGSNVLGVGLLSLPRFTKMAYNMFMDGTGEAIEEITESFADYLVDNLTNSILGNMGSKERLKVDATNMSEWFGTFGGIGEGGLTDQSIMAFGGAYILGIPTNTIVTIDSAMKYNASGEARKYWSSALEFAEKNNNAKDIDTCKGIIELIDNERKSYEVNNVTKGALIKESDQVAPAPTVEDALNVTANAFKLDVCDSIETAEKRKQKAMKVFEMLNEELQNRGLYSINSTGTDTRGIDLETYLKADPETRQATKQVLEVINGFGEENGGDYKIDSEYNVVDKNGEIVSRLLNDKKSGVKSNTGITVNPFSNKVTQNNVAQTERKAVADVISEVFTHEIVHKTEGTEQYAQLKQDVRNTLGEEKWKQLKNEIYKAYRKQGKFLNSEKSEAEIVAKYVENNLGNLKFLKQLSQYNNSAFTRVYTGMKALLKNDANSKIANDFFKAYHEAVDEAINSKTPKLVFGDLISANDCQFNISQYKEKGRDVLQRYLDKQVENNRRDNTKGLTREDADAIINELDYYAKMIDEVSHNPDKVFTNFNNWSDVSMTTDHNGNPQLTCVVSNGDYKMNIDFSTVCKKRKMADVLFNELAKSGVLDAKALTPEQIAQLRQIVKKNDLEVACSLCFVDSKRFNQGGWADTLVNGKEDKIDNKLVKLGVQNAETGHIMGWNEMVQLLKPDGVDIDTFNFAERQETRGGTLHTLTDSELNQDGLKKLREIASGVSKKSEIGKMANALLNNPDLRKEMLLGDLYGSTAFGNIKKGNQDFFKIVNQHQGVAKPKSPYVEVTYNNEIIKSTTFNPSRARNVGGVRIQSFSDYMSNMIFDYIEMVGELQAKGLTAHSYTKVTEYAELFGMTGIKINLSLIPRATLLTPQEFARLSPEEKEAVKLYSGLEKMSLEEFDALPDSEKKRLEMERGLSLSKDGSCYTMYIFEDESFGNSEIDGKDPNRGYLYALELQSRDGYDANVGTICVGVSDEHIWKMLNDDNIKMVIPYHKSSLNSAVAHMMNIGAYKDYTAFQNTRVLNENGEWSAIGSAKDFKYKDFKWYADKNGMANNGYDAKASAKAYLEYCSNYQDHRGNSLLPKFDEFAYNEVGQGKGDWKKRTNGSYEYVGNGNGNLVINDNYYKLLIDFRAYDNNGNIAPENNVELKFADNFNEQVINSLSKYEERMNVQNSKVDEVVNEATREIESVEQFDIDSDGNEISQEQAWYFKDSKVRDENGNLLVVYHGTNENFTVFDYTKTRANMDIQGNFFSPWEIDAGGYGENVGAYYLNITNPADFRIGFNALKMYQGQNGAGTKAREYLISQGYDGVINDNEEYIAFYPEQIKRVDNFSPTFDEDVRFDIETDADEIFKTSESRRNINKFAFNDNGTINSFEYQLSHLNEMNQNDHLIVSTNSKLKGYGIPNTVTTISRSSVAYAKRIHHLVDEDIKNIISKYNDPSLVVDSKGNKAIFTDFWFMDGKHKKLAVLYVDPNGRLEIRPNVIATIYGRKNIQNYLNGLAKGKNNFYITKKTNEFLTSYELKLPQGAKIVGEYMLTPNNNYVKNNNNENFNIDIDDKKSRDTELKNEFINVTHGQTIDYERAKQIATEYAELYNKQELLDKVLKAIDKEKYFTTQAYETNPEAKTPFDFFEEAKRQQKHENEVAKKQERAKALKEANEYIKQNHNVGSNNIKEDFYAKKNGEQDILSKQINEYMPDLPESARQYLVDVAEGKIDPKSEENTEPEKKAINYDSKISKERRLRKQQTAELIEILKESGNDKKNNTMTLWQMNEEVANNNKKARKLLTEYLEKPFTEAQKREADIREDGNKFLSRLVDDGFVEGSKKSEALQFLLEGVTNQLVDKSTIEDLSVLPTFYDKNGDPIDINTVDKVYKPYSEADVYNEFSKEDAEKIIKYAREMRMDYDNLIRLMNTQIIEEIYGDVKAHFDEIVNKSVEELKEANVQLNALAQSVKEDPTNVELAEMYESKKIEVDDMSRKLNTLIEKQKTKDIYRRQLIPYRKNYAYHFSENGTFLQQLWDAVRNTDSSTPTDLISVADRSKPRTKWASFMARRKGGEYVADAVKGYKSYLNQASTKVAYDPYISQLRDFSDNIGQLTTGTQLNDYKRFIDLYANDLAGKTNTIDKGFSEASPIFTVSLRIAKVLNRRVKPNTLLGNVRSSLVQAGNLPNAMEVLVSKGGKEALGDIARGTANYLSSMFNPRAEENNSAFLRSRFGKEVRTDFSLLEGGKRKLEWMMGALDEIVTKATWYSALEQGKRVGADDVYFYADDITRRAVAGRGTGEVPVTLKSELINTLLPFQVEVNNVWHTMARDVKDKKFGALLTMLVANWLMNDLYDKLFGDRPLFDPIDAIADGFKENKGEVAVTRLFGEVAGANPFTSALLPMVFNDDQREKLFGESDPSRYGTQNVSVKALGTAIAQLYDPNTQLDGLATLMYNYGLPYGGTQLKRMIETLQTYGYIPQQVEGDRWEMSPINYTKKGKITYVNDNPFTSADNFFDFAQQMAFGKYAGKNYKNYVDSGFKTMSDSQTTIFDAFNNNLSAYESFRLTNEYKDISGLKGADGKTVSNSESAQKRKLLEDNGSWESYKENNEEGKNGIGKTVYNMDSKEFADYYNEVMSKAVEQPKEIAKAEPEKKKNEASLSDYFNSIFGKKEEKPTETEEVVAKNTTTDEAEETKEKPFNINDYDKDLANLDKSNSGHYYQKGTRGLESNQREVGQYRYYKQPDGTYDLQVWNGKKFETKAQNVDVTKVGKKKTNSSSSKKTSSKSTKTKADKEYESKKKKALAVLNGSSSNSFKNVEKILNSAIKNNTLDSTLSSMRSKFKSQYSDLIKKYLKAHPEARNLF